jgi:hypothetical protein
MAQLVRPGQENCCAPENQKAKVTDKPSHSRHRSSAWAALLQQDDCLFPLTVTLNPEFDVAAGAGVAITYGRNHLSQEFIDLLRGAADKLRRLHEGVEIDSGESRVGGEPLQEVVGPALFFDDRGGCLTVAADPLVQVLPVAAGRYRLHQDDLGRHEGQFGIEMGGDNFRIDDQAGGYVLAEDQDRVGGQESLGQRQTP